MIHLLCPSSSYPRICDVFLSLCDLFVVVDMSLLLNKFDDLDVGHELA